MSFIYFFIAVKLVTVSYYFGVQLGDDVAVVAGLGALVVPPGAAVAVGTMPCPLPKFPMDITD